MVRQSGIICLMGDYRTIRLYCAKMVVYEEFWEFFCDIALLQGKITSTGFCLPYPPPHIFLPKLPPHLGRYLVRSLYHLPTLPLPTFICLGYPPTWDDILSAPSTIYKNSNYIERTLFWCATIKTRSLTPQTSKKTLRNMFCRGPPL